MKIQYLLTASSLIRRKIVRKGVLDYLRNHTSESEQWSTTDLAEALWPIAEAQGPEITTRKAFIDDLLRLARTELKGVCVRQGQPDSHRKFMGKPLIPWVWYRPAETHENLIKNHAEIECPQCGHLFTPAAATK